MGGMAPEGSEPREFSLRQTATTRIGSRADADLQLDGLAEDHAEIRYERGDEYVLVDLGAPAGSRVNGQPIERAELHTGDRIEMGGWTLSYFREEYADHGRPFGGRSGGESLHEPPHDYMPGIV
jgi:pSer/pThr/pTyr-binding forkhead associated (FHA) protein